jgi:hypothetical protein
MQARQRSSGTLLSLYFGSCSTTCRRLVIDTRAVTGGQKRQKGTIAASSIKKSSASVKKLRKSAVIESPKSETKELKKSKGEVKKRKESFWKQDRTKILAFLDKAEAHIGITKVRIMIPTS